MVVMDERGGGWFASWKCLRYRLMRRRISVAKSCIGGERMWFLMGL